jgi:hypothetical protein
MIFGEEFHTPQQPETHDPVDNSLPDRTGEIENRQL